MKRRRISMEELEARGLPGPAMAVALLLGMVVAVAAVGVAFYGAALGCHKIAGYLFALAGRFVQ